MKTAARAPERGAPLTPTDAPGRIRRVGSRALRALARSDRIVTPLSRRDAGPWFRAGGELVWIGAALPAMHPRAVITTLPVPGSYPIVFDALPARGWTPARVRLGHGALPRYRAGLRRLCRELLAGQSPRGFGVLLGGKRPPLPLARAMARVEALAEGYAREAPAAVLGASMELLGTGPGLTPAGDDLAGAALFARRVLAPRRRAWSQVARTLADVAPARTHPVSAALLDDLARGRSFAPLHALAQALADGRHADALAAALELTAIGHSSGWDMLAGFALGITGRTGAAP